MRHWKRNSILAVLVAFVVFVGRKACYDYAIARDAREREKTMDWLRLVIVPKVEFRDTPLKEAVGFLNRTITQTAGHPKGLRIEFATAKETAASFRKTLAAPTPHSLGLDKVDPVKSDAPAVATEPEDADKPGITFEETNVPLYVTLRYVSGLADRVIETRGRVIRLHDVHGASGTCDQITTKTFHLRPGGSELFIRGFRAWQSNTNSEEEPVGDVIDFREFMSASGVTIYEGDSIDLHKKTDVLAVRSTQENIDLISTLLDYSIEPSVTGRLVWWTRSLISTTPSAPPSQTLPNGGLPRATPSEDIPGL